MNWIGYGSKTNKPQSGKGWLSQEDWYFHFKQPLCPWTLSATGGRHPSQNVFTIPTNKWCMHWAMTLKKMKKITKGRNVFHRLSISFIGFVFREFLEPPSYKSELFFWSAVRSSSNVRCVSHCYTRVSITKSDILAWEMTLSSLLYCVMWRLNILTRLQLLPM